MIPIPLIRHCLGLFPMAQIRSASIPRSARFPLSILLGLAALSSSLHAQTFWDDVSRYDVSYGAQFATQRGTSLSESLTDRPASLTANFIGLSSMIGFYLPLESLGDEFSCGIQPNAAATIGFISLSDMDQGESFRLDLPLFAMIRYGADAEYSAKATFGTGAGIGVDPQLLAFNNITGVGGFYLGSQIVLEAGTRIRSLGLLKLRFITDLAPVSIDEPWTNQRVYDGRFIGHLDYRTYSLYISVNKKF